METSNTFHILTDGDMDNVSVVPETQFKGIKELELVKERLSNLSLIPRLQKNSTMSVGRVTILNKKQKGGG